MALPLSEGAAGAAGPDDGGARFELVLVLPRSGHNLRAVERSLDGATLDAWLGALEPRYLEVSLPRFQLDGASATRVALEALGIRTIARPHLAIDLGGPPELGRVSAMSALRVDEKGVGARDAISIEMVVRGEMPTITFDRPFLVFLQDRESDPIIAARP